MSFGPNLFAGNGQRGNCVGFVGKRDENLEEEGYESYKMYVRVDYLARAQFG